jgi:hypothetical protein
MTRSARAQHVQAHPRHDRGQPGTGIHDRCGIVVANAKPGLLERIFGFGRRPEHAKRDGAQAPAFLLEALRQLFAVGHLCTGLSTRGC